MDGVLFPYINFSTNSYLRISSPCSMISSAYCAICSGGWELYNGTVELKDETEEFSDKTSDIDTKIEDQIQDTLDKMSGSDYEPVSFTSTENPDIGLVQFAIRTSDIKIAEEEEVETEAPKETILDKMKNLF